MVSLGLATQLRGPRGKQNVEARGAIKMWVPWGIQNVGPWGNQNIGVPVVIEM
jgi:hypothetical protein